MGRATWIKKKGSESPPGQQTDRPPSSLPTLDAETVAHHNSWSSEAGVRGQVGTCVWVWRGTECHRGCRQDTRDVWGAECHRGWRNKRPGIWGVQRVTGGGDRTPGMCGVRVWQGVVAGHIPGWLRESITLKQGVSWPLKMNWHRGPQLPALLLKLTVRPWVRHTPSLDFATFNLSNEERRWKGF